MTRTNYKQISEFKLEGRFISFGFEDKLKYIRLVTSESEYDIKLCKKLRNSGKISLTPGDWVQVTGEKKLDRESGKLKLKAEQVVIVIPDSAPANSAISAKPKANILVCQKSDCLKRGSKAVCQALEAGLSARGIERVAVKKTGCMKKCSAGPNLVMPDKTRHSRVTPVQVPGLLATHFPVAEGEFTGETYSPSALH